VSERSLCLMRSVILSQQGERRMGVMGQKMQSES